MRGLATAILTLAVCARAMAGDDEATRDRVRVGLTSRVPSEVAWALHDAIEAKVPDLDDLVRDVVAAWAGPASGSRAVRTAAIDALIELDIAVPGGRLHDLARDTGVERRLLLCARDPAACRDVLVGLLSEATEDDAWIATCNLLLPLRDASLTSHLLGHLRVEAHLTVRDPGDDRIHLGGGAGGSFGTGCGRVGPPDVEGWPPRFRWQLVSKPRRGARLVAAGREPIYAYREGIDTGDFVCHHFSGAESRERRASEYVADLLHRDPERLRSTLSEYRTIDFTDLTAWRAAVRDVSQALGRRWVQLLGACILDGLLTVRQALALPPRAEFVIRDARATKQPVLEVPPALGRARR